MTTTPYRVPGLLVLHTRSLVLGTCKPSPLSARKTGARAPRGPGLARIAIFMSDSLKV